MIYIHSKSVVYNKGRPPDGFLQELIIWGRTADDDIFAVNDEPYDIYGSVKPEMGPYSGIPHRKAVMLECMRVLGGFESTWNWEEGPDQSVPPSQQTPYTMEAGLWQISANSRNLGVDLASMSPADPVDFQEIMKFNHPFAMEYTARLLRHTTHHNGPALRKEINPWLRRESVGEFTALLFNP